MQQGAAGALQGHKVHQSLKTRELLSTSYAFDEKGGFGPKKSFFWTFLGHFLKSLKTRKLLSTSYAFDGLEIPLTSMNV